MILKYLICLIWSWICSKYPRCLLDHQNIKVRSHVTTAGFHRNSITIISLKLWHNCRELAGKEGARQTYLNANTLSDYSNQKWKWRILASSWNFTDSWGILLVHCDTSVGYFNSKLEFCQFLKHQCWKKQWKRDRRGQKALFTFTALSYVISLCLRDPYPNGTTQECKNKDLSA